MIPLILSEDSLVTVVEGEHHRIERNSRLYQQVIDAVRNDATEAEVLVLLKSDGMADYLKDADIECVDGKFVLDGEEVHHTIVERVKDFAAAGLPICNLEAFERRRRENVSFASSEEAFDFLQNKGMPVTDDGCFLAYKAVNSNYTDKYTGTIDNHPGQIVKMTRRKVDDNRDHGCSYGLHVGSLEYAEGYGGYNSVILLVKVDPKDIVSVPTCSSCQKCRVCEYTVLKVVRGPLEEPLYSAYGEEIEGSPYGDDFDEDGFWDDEYEEDYSLDDDYDSINTATIDTMRGTDGANDPAVEEDDEDDWNEGEVVSWPTPPSS